MAQLAQFFATDAQRFSVHQERPRPAADDVAACSRASATRSTSQLAGWPALLQPPCRPSRAKWWFRRQALCKSLISGSGTEDDEESGDPCLTQAEDLDGDFEASGSSGGVFLDSAASGSDPSEDQSNPSNYVPTWRRGSESPPPRSTTTASP